MKSLMLIMLLCLPLSVNAGPPTEMLRNTIDDVLVVLDDAQMEKSAKREKVRGLINNRFDYETMSRSTLAQNWKQATPEQQQRFMALHARAVQDTYLVMVEEYNDQAVQYRDEQIKKERYAQVDTLILDAGKEIPVTYKLRLKDDEWLVYDVVIEGVSMISNYRSSYQQMVKTDGLDGLLAKLGSKLEGATE